MQIATDAHLGLVADVRVTQDVNDKYQLLPAIEGVAVRWLRKPNQIVADGDFTTHLSVMQMAEREIDFFGSWNPVYPLRLRQGGYDPRINEGWVL